MRYDTLDSGSEPPLPVSHAINRGKPLILYSALCCYQFLELCIVFCHPIMSPKYSSVSPASGEKKAITLELKLKIVSQL